MKFAIDDVLRSPLSINDLTTRSAYWAVNTINEMLLKLAQDFVPLGLENMRNEKGVNLLGQIICKSVEKENMWPNMCR